MNQSQANFLKLAKEYEELKEQSKAKSAELNNAMLEVGFDAYVQDPETLLVYKVTKPTGTFIEYKEIGYKRTAKEGERGGTVLSKKEAEEAGFTLKK